MIDIHVIEVDYTHPHKGIVSQGHGFLFNMSGGNNWGVGYKHMCLTLVHLVPLLHDESLTKGFVRLKFCNGSTCVTGIFGQSAGGDMNYIQFSKVVDVTASRVRIQKWVRNMNRLRKSKKLAVCMGFHPRLGVNSLLANLHSDIVRFLIL
jgi:hypothetical protein